MLYGLLLLSLEGATLRPCLVNPGLMARCVVALLAFAQLESMSVSVPPGAIVAAAGPMQTAQRAAAWLRRHPKAALQMQLAEAPNDVTAAAALVRFVSWVASAGPIATASAVLLEALPALEGLACTSEALRQELAEVGSRWEWDTRGGGAAPASAAAHGGTLPAAGRACHCCCGGHIAGACGRGGRCHCLPPLCLPCCW